MDKLCDKCSKPIPTTIIIDNKRRNLSKRRYCLECSPFGRHNTKRLNGKPTKNCGAGGRIHPKFEETKRMYESGKSIRNVARLINMSPATIQLWIKQGKIKGRSHQAAIDLAVLDGRMKGAYHWNDISRAKQRANMLRRIAENPMNHPNRKLAGNRNKMSFPEKLAYDTLVEAGFNPIHNIRIDIYYPDFLINKTIIEIDGERWHNSEKDAVRDAKLNLLGYKVYRFKSKEVVKDSKIILSVLSECRP